MTYEQCKDCSYCQKRWNMDVHGNFTNSYYGCNYAPHWGKHIETIGMCPKKANN